MENEEITDEYVDLFQQWAILDMNFRIKRHYEKHYGRPPSLKEHEIAFKKVLDGITFDPKIYKRQVRKKDEKQS